MANKYSFSGQVGFFYEEVTALANNSSVTINISPYKNSSFTVVAESSTGVISVPSASTFSVTVNRVTGIVTITNISGAAYTGSYKIFGVFN